MGVDGLVVEAVVDDHMASVSFVELVRDDGAVAGGVDGSADGSGEVHARVEFFGLVDGVHPVSVGGADDARVFVF